MRWTLRQTPDMPAGTAELRCDRCDLDAGSVELCISQPQAGGGLLHLDPRDADRPWGTSEFWQAPGEAARDGDGLRLRVDAFTTFHLGANKPYILSLRDAAGRRDGVPLLGIALRLPSAPPKGWRPAEARPPEPEPEPAPEPELPAVEEPPAPEPAPLSVDPGERPHEAPRRRNPMVPILAAVALLAVASAAAWWYLGRPPEEPPPAPEVAQPPAPAPAERTLALAREMLAAKPPAAEARAAGEAHLAAKDLEGGFLLLRYAAENGDLPAAVAVGGLYDPATWSAESSPLPAPNAEQAAGWYRRAAEAGDAEAEYRLGMVLRSGRTEAPDGPEQAVGWLRKAAEQGHAKAKETLGQ